MVHKQCRSEMPFNILISGFTPCILRNLQNTLGKGTNSSIADVTSGAAL